MKGGRSSDSFHGAHDFYGQGRQVNIAAIVHPPHGQRWPERVAFAQGQDGDKISYLGARTIEIIEANPKDPALRDKRLAITGGRLYPGEWYNWHAAYIAPFAWKQRLYIRSFDHLYCFGEKQQTKGAWIRVVIPAPCRRENPAGPVSSCGWVNW